MKLDLKYGSGTRTLTLADQYEVDVIQPGVSTAEAVTTDKIIQVIHNPIKSTCLSAHRQVKNVAIAINDKTRPVRYDLLLPPLLEILHQELNPGIEITLFVASGTHTPMSMKECAEIIPGFIFEKYPIHVRLR